MIYLSFIIYFIVAFFSIVVSKSTRHYLFCVFMYKYYLFLFFFFFSSRRRHTRYWRDWSSDVCSSDLRELRELYRVHSLDKETTVVGLVGKPVSHSLSPHMHNAAFAARRVNAVYVPFDVTDVSGFVRRMAHPRTRELQWNLRGFSVTAPHKSAIVGHLDWVEPLAVEIGAVNTVVI